MDQKVLRYVRTSFEEEYSRELFFEGSWLSRFVKRYSAHLLRRSFGGARTWLWRTAKPYKYKFFCMIINIAPNIDNIVTLLSKIAVTSFISVLIFLSRRWSHLMCTAAHQCEESNFYLNLSPSWWSHKMIYFFFIRRNLQNFHWWFQCDKNQKN